ncbi:MAG: hypothetical protein M1831_001547 [Alyxoria varia]|nr:MAG: hypothetical protein M1831_001547 [Alyxoria varia]
MAQTSPNTSHATSHVTFFSLPREIRNVIYEDVLCAQFNSPVYISVYNPLKAVHASCRFCIPNNNHAAPTSYEDEALHEHLQNHVRMPRTVPKVHAQFLRTNRQIWFEASQFLYKNRLVFNMSSSSVFAVMLRLADRNSIMLKSVVFPACTWAKYKACNRIFWPPLKTFLKEAGVLNEVIFAKEVVKFRLPGGPEDHFARRAFRREMDWEAFQTEWVLQPELDEDDYGEKQEDMYFATLERWPSVRMVPSSSWKCNCNLPKTEVCKAMTYKYCMTPMSDENVGCDHYTVKGQSFCQARLHPHPIKSRSLSGRSAATYKDPEKQTTFLQNDMSMVPWWILEST